VPVNPSEASGDLAGIAEVRQYELLDLILVATGLARTWSLPDCMYD
jgi:hypothetical protein